MVSAGAEDQEEEAEDDDEAAREEDEEMEMEWGRGAGACTISWSEKVEEICGMSTSTSSDAASTAGKPC
jgi:hypothetical protein